MRPGKTHTGDERRDECESQGRRQSHSPPFHVAANQLRRLAVAHPAAAAVTALVGDVVTTRTAVTAGAGRTTVTAGRVAAAGAAIHLAARAVAAVAARCGRSSSSTIAARAAVAGCRCG